MKKEGKMSVVNCIKGHIKLVKNEMIRQDMLNLIDIIEKKDEAINELLINIELSHPEEYKQYRELPAVDEAYKLTEE